MATKRKALGRGLGALLPSAPAAADSSLEIPVDRIVPNKYQPRSHFEPESLKDLAQSIKSNGVIQPIVVRKTGAQYQIIAGERRWRAAQLIGLKTVPAVVRDVSEYRMVEMALIENIQRQDLNPLEEASAYVSLIEDFELTQEELAQRVGKDRSSIANYIRLLKLPMEVKEKIQRQELTMGHARALTSMEKSKEQIELADRIIREQLNVRQTEAMIRNWKAQTKRPQAVSRETPKKDPNVRAAEAKLQEHFGTRVIIHQDAKEKGKIEIYYQDNGDLIRIYDLILSEGE